MRVCKNRFFFVYYFIYNDLKNNYCAYQKPGIGLLEPCDLFTGPRIPPRIWHPSRVRAELLDRGLERDPVGAEGKVHPELLATRLRVTWPRATDDGNKDGTARH